MLSDLLRFSLLGLGPRAVYALLAIGVVVVYRGSGVVAGVVAALNGLSYSLRPRLTKEAGVCE